MVNGAIGISGDSKPGITKELSRTDAARQVKEVVSAFLSAPVHRQLRNHGAEIDADARRVLQRLGESRNSDRVTAAQSIAASVPASDWPMLFADCIIAERRARQHIAAVSNARAVLDRADEADKAINLLKTFLGDPGRSAEQAVCDPVDDALAVLLSAVSMRRRLATDHLGLFSRKTTPEASRALGVGWIRDSLESLGRRHQRTPKPRHIAAIATAALGMGDVTEDAARKAPGMRDRLADHYSRRVR